MKINKELLETKYYDEYLKELIEVIKIPSEKGKSVPGAMFGQATKDALKYVLGLAKSWGFDKQYVDPEGYYGYFDFGTGPNIFLIAPHLDVVTAGNYDFWKKSPYEPIIEDNKLFGRGAIDDKSPAMANLFAIKYLKDNGFDPGHYTIRIAFGLDEEGHMECMKKYVQDWGVPDFGYTPDGAFPCVYAEKAIINVDFKGYYDSPITIKKANADKIDYNVVLDHVIYEGPDKDKIVKFLKENNIESKELKDGLHVYGRPGRGSMPETGINAGTWLLHAISQATNLKHPFADMVSQYVHNQFNLEKLIGEKLEDESGPITASPGHILVENGYFVLGINFRVPSTIMFEKFALKPMEQKLGEMNMKIKTVSYLKPIYFDQESWIIKTMIKVFKEHNTNPNAVGVPIAMDGGTYSKVIPNLIACGMAEDYSNLSMHQYNEWVGLDHLKRTLVMYTNLIVELLK